MSSPAEDFGTRWLEGRLGELLPAFPDLALCVAFSGGPDSSALLAALAQLRHRPRALRAVHVDHGLHPDSAVWAARALEIAHSLGVPCAVRRIRIERRRGESPEAAARAARYGELGAALAEGEVLLTAHHEDDQLETVLLQLLRGAGVAGLAAMPEVMRFARGWLVRPLLTRSRAQLLAWVRGSGLECLEDPSNVDERFDRNFLRQRVLPVIAKRWPAAAATVHRSARHAAEAQRLLDELAQADLRTARHGEALAASALRALAIDRRRNALRFWISARGQPVPPAARLNEIAGSLLAAAPMRSRASSGPAAGWSAMRASSRCGVVRLHGAARRPMPPRRGPGSAGAGGSRPCAHCPTAWESSSCGPSRRARSIWAHSGPA